MMTGYFGRASSKGVRAISTKTHVVEGHKPICGYRPHSTMLFQWCAPGIQLSYVECPKCKVLAQKRLAGLKGFRV